MRELFEEQMGNSWTWDCTEISRKIWIGEKNMERSKGTT